MPATLERSVGRKKTAKPSKTVRIEEDVHDLASRVAALEGKDVSAYLSELLRPLLERSLFEHAKKIVQGGERQPKR
jgi:hypothetical protein